MSNKRWIVVVAIWIVVIAFGIVVACSGLGALTFKKDIDPIATFALAVNATVAFVLGGYIQESLSNHRARRELLVSFCKDTMVSINEIGSAIEPSLELLTGAVAATHAWRFKNLSNSAFDIVTSCGDCGVKGLVKCEVASHQLTLAVLRYKKAVTGPSEFKEDHLRLEVWGAKTNLLRELRRLMIAINTS